MRAQRLLQTGAVGTQAMPIFEQIASPPGLRVQVRQPSVHSRQSALGGVNGPAFLAGGTGRDGDDGASAAMTAAGSHRASNNATPRIGAIISAR
jgi:hypothetical protein